MFYSCSDIVEIDLSQFDTSEVNTMESMFYGCSQLTSVNFSSINTASVTNMKNMFRDCSKLTSINLSNLDTSKVTTMENMFSDCISLEYINFKNFVEHDPLDYSNMFRNIPENIVICLNESNINLFNEINKHFKCYSNCCSDDWKTEQIKKVQKNDLCYYKEFDGISYKYLYKGKYYENCENGHLKNEANVRYCECTNDCPSCAVSFNDIIYKKENDNNNMQGKVNCYIEPEGYYLDINELI